MVCLAVWAGCSPRSEDAREARNRYMRRAYAAKEAQDIDGAIEWCRQALERRPNLALAHRELALMLDQYREDHVGAIYHYRRYLELRPDLPDRQAVEDLIRHCRVSLAMAVSDTPEEWQRDLQVRNERIRELEKEIALWRAGGASPTPGASAPTARRAEPAAATARPAAQEPMQMHVVQAGENLATISLRYYGTRARWKTIFDANRDRLTNANNLRVGDALVIPPP